MNTDDSIVPTTTVPLQYCDGLITKAVDLKTGEEILPHIALAGDEIQHPKYIYPMYGFGDEKMLSLLDSKDLINGKPRARALRQLIVKVVGPITDEDCEVSHFGVSELGYYAVVINHISVRAKNPLWTDGADNLLAASAAADALTGNGETYNGNMAEGFNRFPTANADTRAKARSYIGLLGLNINAAEEMTEANDDKSSFTNKINGDPLASNIERQTMLSVMAQFTEKHNIKLDPERVVKHLGYQYNTLTKNQVVSVNSSVQNWMRSPKTFPKEMVGK